MPSDRHNVDMRTDSAYRSRRFGKPLEYQWLSDLSIRIMPIGIMGYDRIDRHKICHVAHHLRRHSSPNRHDEAITLGKRVASAFRMDDDTWERHANPWSVWSRTTALPALILAAWSRVWIGWWALVPGLIALLWTWLNPRLFGKPSSLNSWASKCVLGERIWINRDEEPVPERHRFVLNVLNAMTGIGNLVVIWGVVQLAIWPTIFGAALAYIGKLWFLDRMVWLYEDMKDATPEYKTWRS